MDDHWYSTRRPNARIMLTVTFNLLTIALTTTGAVHAEDPQQLADSHSPPRSLEKSCGNTYADSEVQLSTGEWIHRSQYVPEYSCPLSPGSPKTECCDDLLPLCCREPRFWEVQAFVAIFIILAAIVFSVVVLVLVLLCFCYEPCPLYSSMMRNAKPDYIAGPEEATTLNMPYESNVRVYEVNSPRSTPKFQRLA